MRKKIFRSLVIGIFGTGVLVFLLIRIVSGEIGRKDDSLERSARWLGTQISQHWDSQSQIERFANETASELGADVVVRNAAGQELAKIGTSCRAPMVVPVSKNGTAVGSLDVCFHHLHSVGWRIAISLFICFAVLWWVSGKAARRMTRPLDELTNVVQRIGAGDLSARARFNTKRDNEIAVVGQAVNEMAGRIQKQLDDQKELLAAVSHEFRTPLSRLKLISEISR
jgi:two-component system, OmpR family, sensor kinase